MERPLALVVDGDQEARSKLRTLLEKAGVEALESASGSAALELLRTHPVRLLLTDSGTPGVETTDFLRRAARARPALVSLILASGPDPGEWDQALPEGAYDVVPKPVEAGRLRVITERALEHHRLLEEVAALRDRLRGRSGYLRMVGRSALMERLRERLERQAGIETPVLLIGEPGTGKELAARTIHGMSSRSDGPFATVGCGSTPESVLEADLFGRDRGVLPGSDRRSVGLLESAFGGSLFLDEVTALPPRLQERLAEVLQEGSFHRVGGAERIPMNGRLFSSSSRDVERAVQEGRLREDLYRRLSAGVVQLPPLRERREDVALLAGHFIDAVCEINNLPLLHLSPEALERLEAHSWPGNVRELRNAVEQAVILATDSTIRPRDLPRALLQSDGAAESEPTALSRQPFRAAKREVVESFEKSYLHDLLERHGGNVTMAAQDAGMLRSALQRLLRKYDIRSARFRRSRRDGVAPESS